MSFIDDIKAQAKSDKKRIVLPEYMDSRTYEAAVKIAQEGIADIVLIGTPEEIAANKGDKLALEVYEFTGRMLGEACADFAAFSSPEAFIFFGGLTKAGDLIMDPIKKSYNEKVLKIFQGKAKFLISGLDGSAAAVLGASAIGWEI